MSRRVAVLVVLVLGLVAQPIAAEESAETATPSTWVMSLSAASTPLALDTRSAAREAAAPETTAAVRPSPIRSNNGVAAGSLRGCMFRLRLCRCWICGRPTLRSITGPRGRSGDGLVGHPVVMVAVKAGVNAAVILATERLAKRNRVAAVATMVALNSAYAMIVRHNLRVAEQLPAR